MLPLPALHRPSRSPSLRLARLVCLLTLASLLGGCAWLRNWWPRPAAPSPTLFSAGTPFSGPPPILFVHGEGDSAAQWLTTLWRFESNGWPRERLVAIDLPYPLARDDDGVAQEGRSSTIEQREALASEVRRVLQATGSPSVILVAHARGGNAVRHLIDNGDQALSVRVSHAVLGGTPSHGVRADPAVRPGHEFNGAGPFLMALNRPKGPNGHEVTPGVAWLTLRSDRFDKFAQPTGEWIGMPGQPTNVGLDSPALKGATNLMIPGIDHRETAYSPQAFAETFRFLTARAPTVPGITPEPQVVLDGKAFGLGWANQPGRGSYANNLPLAGATVEVWATSPHTGERIGAPLLRKTVGADGRWGPLTTTPTTPLEFVIAAPGYATHHVYRAPFPRSSSIVHLQAARIAQSDRDALAIVRLTRPRGLIGIPRDDVELDGRNPPPGVPPGVPGVDTSTLVLRDAPGRPVVGRFNNERIVGRLWPAVENRLVTLELTH